MAGWVRVVVAVVAVGRAGAQVGGELPGPRGLSGDVSVWPNVESWRNSDPWLGEHHGEIREMRPRVVVVNFANAIGMAAVREHAEGVSRALAESTRWHGFADRDAPAFLRYEVVKYVDLRDDAAPNGAVAAGSAGAPAGERTDGNSSLFPRKAEASPEVVCDYAGLYTEEFARLLGFSDPREEGAYLDLHELINAGYVHELWMYLEHEGPWPALEVAELKQRYDEGGRAVEGEFTPAGNGHDETMPWSGRTFRIAFFNPRRGVGCAMENFGHGLEWTATSGAVPYFSRAFREFAELDLDARFGLPFDSLYAVEADEEAVSYPEEGVMEVRVGGETHRAAPYVAIGGNVHFPPGARRHYDLESPHAVMTTIEHYRLRDGEGGEDLATPFDASRFAAYGGVAPDCMGPWLIYWRQCMPGLGNRCVDDEGAAMKNWWPFLFY
ncbi:MAG TPA: hypothetical protein VFF69_10560 [Phycisphaerales bacterium]|nr:hypothetical protein [Phycisphaerales bacterium]